jgi:hypothetical protein
MTELHSNDGVTFDSALHTFATQFFCARSKREMWAAMGCIDKKISIYVLLTRKKTKNYTNKAYICL